MAFFDDCMAYMADTGVGVNNPGKIKMTGEIERFCVTNDKKGSLNGWLIYRNEMKPSCTFGSWKTGECHTWFAESWENMNKKERAEAKRNGVLARISAKKEQCKQSSMKDAALKAEKIWLNAESDTIQVEAHPYIQRKQIKSHGIRLDLDSGELVVPVLNSAGIVQSIQTISGSGRKKFMPSGKMSNGLFLINGSARHVFIAEGFATAATIHEITGSEVYVCFNAGNIENVVRIAKMNRPSSRIVICADNDHHLPDNVGVNKAIAAAKATDTAYMLMGTDKHGTDWNDIYCEVGPDECAAIFAVQYEMINMLEGFHHDS